MKRLSIKPGFISHLCCRIRMGEEIRRDYDESTGPVPHDRTAARFGDQVHGVIFVVKANDPQLTNETYLKRMKIIREHFRFSGKLFKDWWFLFFVLVNGYLIKKFWFRCDRWYRWWNPIDNHTVCALQLLQNMLHNPSISSLYKMREGHALNLFEGC